MITLPALLKPRKQPVQARATATLAVLHDAAVQVLARDGLALCTTTRIAERAGVSVGSLYQYYPNRDALLAAVLSRHLEAMAVAIETICDRHRQQPVATLAGPLVSAFLAVKFDDIDASRALYAVANERGGPTKVTETQARVRAAIADMLASAPDACFDRPEMVAAIAYNAMAGPVRAALDGHIPRDTLSFLADDLTRLVGRYLESYRTDPA